MLPSRIIVSLRNFGLDNDRIRAVGLYLSAGSDTLVNGDRSY
jgi:hypothetical protein